MFKNLFVKNQLEVKNTMLLDNSRFIDYLCIIDNDDEFSKSFKCIYLGELELKLEHTSGTHATFLGPDIKIEDGIFVYKLFDKRDKFPFLIVHILH